MIDKKVKYSLVFVAVLLLVAIGSATEVENEQRLTHTVRLEPAPESTPVIYPMRQEFVDSFERANIAPWTTGGDAASGLWAMRDTTDQYGPQAPAWAGFQYL